MRINNASSESGNRIRLTKPSGSGKVSLMNDVLNAPGARTESESLLCSAEGFSALADSARVGSGNHPPAGWMTGALYFTLAQALELAVKAWLRTDGVLLGELKGSRYGHNLEKVIDDAKARGFAPASELTPRELQMLNGVYGAGKQLQYPHAGAFAFPPPLAVRNMVDACITAASLKVRGQVNPDNPGASIRPDAKW